MTIHRNALGPAYVHAEALYDNAATLFAFLDAWSVPGRSSGLSAEAAAYIEHNLINAQSEIAALAKSVGPFFPEEHE